MCFGDAPLHVERCRVVQRQGALVGLDGSPPIPALLARYRNKGEHAAQALRLARLGGQPIEQGQRIVASLLLEVGCCQGQARLRPLCGGGPSNSLLPQGYGRAIVAIDAGPLR